MASVWVATRGFETAPTLYTTCGPALRVAAACQAEPANERQYQCGRLGNLSGNGPRRAAASAAKTKRHAVRASPGLVMALGVLGAQAVAPHDVVGPIDRAVGVEVAGEAEVGEHQSVT